MTRKLLLATSAIACLVLVACNKQPTATDTTTPSTSTVTTTTAVDSPANGPSGTGDLGAAPTVPPVGAESASSSVADTAAQTNTAPDTAGTPYSNSAVDEAQLPAANTAEGFVQRVGMSDQFEIQSSKLALLRPASAEVKAFAQMMIDAHTATSAKVKEIATKDSLALPAGLTADQQATLDKLRSAPDTGFVSMFIGAQTQAHQVALKLLKDFAAAGDNADLKEFAADTAPKVQEHLTKAQALAKAQGNPS